MNSYNKTQLGTMLKESKKYRIQRRCYPEKKVMVLMLFNRFPENKKSRGPGRKSLNKDSSKIKKKNELIFLKTIYFLKIIF